MDYIPIILTLMLLCILIHILNYCMVCSRACFAHTAHNQFVLFSVMDISLLCKAYFALYDYRSATLASVKQSLH